MNIVVLHGRPFFKMCLIILEGDTEQIDRLDRANLLYLVMQKFAEEVDLSPKAVSNNEMGYIFEDLIRRFSEMSNETAGEHFTPREVIRLMVSILFDPDMKHICEPFFMAKLYDKRIAYLIQANGKEKFSKALDIRDFENLPGYCLAA